MSQILSSFFTPPKLDKLSYFPQIDGLRAFAVLAVFIEHFLKASPITEIHWGRIGVIHFFVISGLLITLILLKKRGQLDEQPGSRWTILKNFYARRFIRIFPIYYLTIAILFIAGYQHVTENIYPLLTYTVNISQGFFDGYFGNTTHFWSLSVEEQFYIFFPLLILFLKRKHIPYFLIALIGLSMGYKYFGMQNDLGWIATSRFLVGCLDSLALGALYAYYLLFYDKHQRAFRLLLGVCFFVGIPLLIGTQHYIIHMEGSFKDSIFYVTFMDMGISMTSIVLLHLAVKNSKWLPGYILRLAPIRYIGKISYGAYLFHFLLRDLEPWSNSPTEKFLILTLLSLGLASLSWNIVEQPINRLKQHFPYLGKPDSSRSINHEDSDVIHNS